LTVDLIFSIAELVLLTAYFSRSILALRLISIIGLAFFVIGALISGVKHEGMMALLIFNGLSLVVNAYQSIMLFVEKAPIFLPPDIKQIYMESFQIMTTKQFYKIYKFATIRQYTKNALVTEQGKPVPELIVIKAGTAEVDVNNKTVAQLGLGFFIGEMSFLTDNIASGTVRAKDVLTCIVWEKNRLAVLENSASDLYIKLQEAIALNLIKKLHSNSLKKI
jgi:hypothetical protein